MARGVIRNAETGVISRVPSRRVASRRSIVRFLVVSFVRSRARSRARKARARRRRRLANLGCVTRTRVARRARHERRRVQRGGIRVERGRRCASERDARGMDARRARAGGRDETIGRFRVARVLDRATGRARGGVGAMEGTRAWMKTDEGARASCARTQARKTRVRVRRPRRDSKRRRRSGPRNGSG